MAPALQLTRDQILAFRRRVGSLDDRLARSRTSLHSAAWAGLQDSMPRAALLSLYARLQDIGPTALDDESLIQVWGPRFSVYVVSARDRGVFTLGRLPEDPQRRGRAQDLAELLRDSLGERELPFAEAARALGKPPNMLRYAAPTGTILIRWDGARQPTIRAVPPPDMEPGEARLELARRYLHVFGPTTAEAFASWAGIPSGSGVAAFDALQPSLAPVRTPIGERWILTSEEQMFRSPPRSPAPARLLPSGDAYYLLQGEDRHLLVPETAHRDLLWTPRVWPGAVLVKGEVAGTWRRAGKTLTIAPWRRFTAAERDALEAEAASMPLPGVAGSIAIRWG